MAQRGLLSELWAFMRERKKFWLLPLFLVLLSVGALFSSDVALTQQMLMWDDGTERTLDLSDDLPPDDGPAPGGSGGAS